MFVYDPCKKEITLSLNKDGYSDYVGTNFFIGNVLTKNQSLLIQAFEAGYLNDTDKLRDICIASLEQDLSVQPSYKSGDYFLSHKYLEGLKVTC